MKYYDLFVPMGAFCATSYHLRQNDLQIEAYPLDWVGVWRITQAAEMLISKFDGFFKKENLVFAHVNGSHNAYMDETNRVAFFHCIDKELPFEEGYAKAKEMFDRRIERLCNRMDAAKSILFVYANNESISENDAKEAYQILKARYPNKKIDLLVFDLKKEYEGIDIKETDKNITFIKMLFDLENDSYSGRKEEFASIYSNYQIASWKNRLKNIATKVIFKTKRIAISLICAVIPSKQIRKNLRKKLKTNHCLFER